MSYYQLGEKALKVPMRLFALNREKLLDRLRKVPNLPKSSIVILEGGKAEMRHCTDHEKLFRQVIDKQNQLIDMFKPIFNGISI